MCAFHGNLWATDYYISPTGNDALDGRTPSSAWQTIEKIHHATFRHGDRILFQRGGVFRGQINLRHSQIYIGAYGEGAKPIISGSVEISGWAKYQGNIYVAQVDGPIENLFVEGKLQTLARYPNEGFLRVENKDFSTQYIASSGLNQAQDHWKGAQVRVQTTQQVYEVGEIAYSGPGQINLAGPLTYGPAEGFGFFLDNKLEELDQAGEWYYDEASKNIYFWPPFGQIPSNLLIEGSTEARGIDLYWKEDTITIENLHFKHQTDRGISFNNNRHVQLVGNTFESISGNAIHTVSAWHIDIQGNTFQDILGRSIYFVADSSVIQDNVFKRNSLVFGYGGEGEHNQVLLLNGFENLFQYNRVDSTGNYGIDLRGERNIITHNYLSNIGLQSNFVAGILLHYSVKKPVVKQNIIQNGWGDPSGKPSGKPATCYGILCGNEASFMEVSHNTISSMSSMGIFVQNNAETKFIGNTIFDTEIPIYATDLNSPAFILNYKNLLTHNKLIDLNEQGYCISLNNVFPNLIPSNFFISDSNYLYNPFHGLVIYEYYNSFGEPVINRYAIERWQTTRKMDSASKVFPYVWETHKVTDTIGNNLIYNSDFNYTITDWSFWPSDQRLSYVTGIDGMDQGALEVFYLGSDKEISAVANHSDLDIHRGQFYALSFKLKGRQMSTLKVKLGGEDNFSNLGLETFFPVYTDTRAYSFLFQANDSYNNGSIQLNNYQWAPLYWLDDVYLYPVSVEEDDPYQKIKLFINPNKTDTLINLGSDIYEDLDGQEIRDSLRITPYQSEVLILKPGRGIILTEETRQNPVGTFRLFPNPTVYGDEIFLRLPIEIQGKRITLSVFSSNGTQLWKRHFPPNSSQLRFNLDQIGEQMNPGIYLMEINQAGKKWFEKLVVL